MPLAVVAAVEVPVAVDSGEAELDGVGTLVAEVREMRPEEVVGLDDLGVEVLVEVCVEVCVVVCVDVCVLVCVAETDLSARWACIRAQK